MAAAAAAAEAAAGAATGRGELVRSEPPSTAHPTKPMPPPPPPPPSSLVNDTLIAAGIYEYIPNAQSRPVRLHGLTELPCGSRTAPRRPASLCHTGLPVLHGKMLR
ncbi:hypothetical protein E2C01_066052 [Portunus trituberculatus]|uniref:Uncharacterized protein n=1 Tax=Portunus trituberculatus TaxID=210409 RepID=A0A5B7HR98_PORTR|nr:hypothetical protein [Portunus trituberculatus]